MRASTSGPSPAHPTNDVTFGADGRGLDAARWALTAIGLAVSVLMVWRSQAGLDQYYLLVRGWMLVSEGWLVPFGNHMSAGGFQPGPATSLFVGLPLFFWEDHRAINLSILLTHLVAYWLLDRTLRDTLGARGRLLLCLLYWFNPWRMYFSAHLWNPNWVFLFGALHLWTANKMRQKPRFGYTLLHVFAIGVVFELHASFLILALASALLYWRGYIRVHWPAAVAGGVLALVPMIPWVFAVLDHPEIMPAREGFMGWGLVTVHPMLRGVGYWLRYPMMHYSQQTVQFDFTPALNQRWDAVLTPIYTVLTVVVGPLTLLFSAAANIWMWRRQPDLRFARFPSDGSKREWVLGYVRWVFVASLISFALSPSTIMMWHALIAMHAAVLPVVFWVEKQWRMRQASRIRLAVVAYSILLFLVMVGMAFGSPLYRKGGRGAWGISVSEPHVMFERLGMLERTTVTIRPDGGVRSPLLNGPEGWYLPDEGRM
jgi:hypothetical protein